MIENIERVIWKIIVPIGNYVNVWTYHNFEKKDISPRRSKLLAEYKTNNLFAETGKLEKIGKLIFFNIDLWILEIVLNFTLNTILQLVLM